MDGCSWEKKGFVLSEVLFLSLCHRGLPLGVRFVQVLMSLGEAFFVDQVTEGTNPPLGYLLGLIG
jgi:hypothetical protein